MSTTPNNNNQGTDNASNTAENAPNEIANTLAPSITGKLNHVEPSLGTVEEISDSAKRKQVFEQATAALQVYCQTLKESDFQLFLSTMDTLDWYGGTLHTLAY